MITVEQFELIQRMAKVYATTIYKAYSIDVIMTMMLRAHGLGLPVTEAPELFQQLHGKLTLSANAMATLIKRAGYSWIVNSLDDDRAELTIYDNAGHELGQSIFTIEDAQQAGIMGKNKNWDNYPRNMLMARALSNAAKWFAPDAFGGAPLYTPDELGSDDDAGYTGIADDTEPTPPNVTDIVPPVDIEAAGDDEDLFQASGVGNISDHMRGQLFQLGSEWASLLHPEDPKFESHRKPWAKSHLPDLNSFTQLNNAGALFLRRMLNVDIITALAFEVYPDEDKETELADWVSPGAQTFDSLSMTALENLKASLKKKLGEKLDKAS